MVSWFEALIQQNIFFLSFLKWRVHAGARGCDGDDGMRLASEFLVGGFDGLEVEQVPPKIGIVAPAGTPREVVRMLPHVQTHDGEESVKVWAVLVGGGDHREIAVTVADKESPAGSELAGSSGGELLPHVLEGPKGGVDGFLKAAPLVKTKRVSGWKRIDQPVSASRSLALLPGLESSEILQVP